MQKFVTHAPTYALNTGVSAARCMFDISEKFMSWVALTRVTPILASHEARSVRIWLIFSFCWNSFHNNKQWLSQVRRESYQPNLRYDVAWQNYPFHLHNQLCPHKPLSGGELRGWWCKLGLDNEEKRGLGADGRVHPGQGGRDTPFWAAGDAILRPKWLSRWCNPQIKWLDKPKILVCHVFGPDVSGKSVRKISQIYIRRQFG